ncbi:amidohydrolase family protein [Actinoallomurus spadix]|uniref:Amidohydrolase family protein n=1 Tax=Actinoallomurus spadix TaxID=79912 RepID=A0ABP3H0J7_9ACTN|nr:amidohydrolase family protein [Actinoallomurus spadix]MCO5987876.1 amidohydrolase family protein [Actinoallomurus spadix]
MTAPTRTALTNVRVFDGHRLTDPRTVVIDGTVIGADPTGAREIDASDAVLLPGLIDAHVHLHSPQTLDTLASWGVTTGLDMACWPHERVMSLREVTGSADFRTAGLPAIGPAGNHARMPGMPAEAIILTPEDARRHVAARAAEGVDYIKGVAEAPGDGGPTSEALRALVAAARAHGLKTVIHAVTVGAYTVAVDSGADFITHTPLIGTIRPEDIVMMQAGNQVAIPTITMMEGILAGKAPIAGLLTSVADLHRAGIEILAGTDANTQPGSPHSVPHGESLHHELELMARAGIGPVDVLRSATVLPARAFGLTDRGAVEPGLRADLVLVDGDPTTDITATRKIRAVWCAGHPITPATGA